MIINSNNHGHYVLLLPIKVQKRLSPEFCNIISKIGKSSSSNKCLTVKVRDEGRLSSLVSIL